MSGFCGIFRAIEDGSSWPQQLCAGIVTTLSKGGQSATVDSYRPVTVILCCTGFGRVAELEPLYVFLQTHCRQAFKEGSQGRRPRRCGTHLHKCWNEHTGTSTLVERTTQRPHPGHSYKAFNDSTRCPASPYGSVLQSCSLGMPCSSSAGMGTVPGCPRT